MSKSRSIRLIPLVALLAGLSGTASASSHPVVREAGGSYVLAITDQRIDGRRTARMPAMAAIPPLLAAAPARRSGVATCDAAALAWYGQPLPGGEAGTLSPSSFMHSATLNDSGRIAFTSMIEGAARNQGVFVADRANGVQIVALGCGAGGGSGSTDTCGDPSPIGGTFTGFFMGTIGTPSINAAGDVLFLADVQGGSAPRGLFLHRAATGALTKVAAVGDASPVGGTITSLGPGMLNDAGTVAFIAASNNDGTNADILRWQDGTVAKYVAAGDAAPGGGTFRALATEFWGLQDGTSLAGGPVPALNAKGRVAFRGYVDNGISGGGLFTSVGGQHEWLVKAGDPAPGGGSYTDFEAPVMNDAGDFAFFGWLAGAATDHAWISGHAGQWRIALAPLQQIGEGRVWGDAISRNPMRALADNGDLVLWTTRQMDADQSEKQTLLIRHPDDSVSILAVSGQESPIGGFWGGSIDAWPVLNEAAQVHIGAATPGFGDAYSGEVLLDLCPAVADTIFVDYFEQPLEPRASR